jgi:homoserine O-succinyltransferase
MAGARIAKHYITLDELHAAPPDALIFSGAEPARTNLRDELFWPGLAELLDWSKAHRIPTLFSCLAAHAAVLHFDGIERRRLAQKTFGVFEHATVADHVWLRGTPRRYNVAHSRWNDLDAKDLIAGGYQVLSRGAQTGVDIFVPAAGAPMLFLQGHPEYEETALLGEYKRDLRRYESGQSAYNPLPPSQEDCGSSACLPNPPVDSLGAFKCIIGNWIERKREMVI